MSRYSRPTSIIEKVQNIAAVAGRDNTYFKVGVLTALTEPDTDLRAMRKTAPWFNTPEQWEEKIMGFEFVKSMTSVINQ